MRDIIIDSFKLNIDFMTFFGFYPSDQPSLCLKVRSYVFYFAFTTITVFTFIGISQQNEPDVINAAFGIESVIFWFKVYPFLRNGHEIKKCIRFFSDCKYSPKDAKEVGIMEECVGVCQRNTNILVRGVVVLVAMMSVQWLYQNKLPYEIWVPYEGGYYPTYLYLVIAVLYGMVTNAIIDPLIGGLAYHATSQLKILKHNLRHLDTYAKESPLFTIKFEYLYQFLKRCVEHHNDIFKFIAIYEECFSLSIFFQIVGSTLGVCFCCMGVITTSASISVNFFKYIGGILVISFQIFFYCYYGTLLYDESDSFIRTMYMGPWYRYDVRIRKTLILIAERSKIPVIITAGEVINITLQTFVSMLKTSYSLIAVFNSFR